MSAVVVDEKALGEAFEKLPADIQYYLKCTKAEYLELKESNSSKEKTTEAGSQDTSKFDDDPRSELRDEEVPIIFKLWARDGNREFLIREQSGMEAILRASCLISFSWVGKLLAPLVKEHIEQSVTEVQKVNWSIRQSPWNLAFLLDYTFSVVDKKSVTPDEFFHLLQQNTLRSDTFPHLCCLCLHVPKGTAGVIQWLWKSKPSDFKLDDYGEDACTASAARDEPDQRVRLAFFSPANCFPLQLLPATNMVEAMKPYLESADVPLKSCRFSLLSGKRLFVSEIRNKGPAAIGLRTGDVLICEDIDYDDETMVKKVMALYSEHKETKRDEEAVIEDAARPEKKSMNRNSNTNRKKMKQKAKKSRGNLRLVPAPAKPTADALFRYRMHHSKQLSRVLDEADSTLRDIRRQLNDLNLKRTPPKGTRQQESAAEKAVEDGTEAFDPDQPITGGKAGRIYFDVKVGDATCLYKTSKPSRRTCHLDRNSASSSVLDLHGCTRDEGRARLDSSMPEWTRKAMEGSSPWVIKVRIVCGGGNQILSEMVEDWIKQNDSVAKAFGS